jgi:Na+/glutamate symporter
MQPTPSPAPPSAAERAQEFVAVAGGEETTSAVALAVAAYGLMWAILLGFLWLTWRRQAKLDARLTDLNRELERANERRQQPAE